jgi:N utilization substance protein B
LETLKRRVTEDSRPIFDGAEYASMLVTEVVGARAYLDGVIREGAPLWPVAQMGAVERTILRIALAELLLLRSAPPRAVVNEAVELAKRYGSDTSSGFVNGVLGKVLGNTLVSGEINVLAGQGA